MHALWSRGWGFGLHFYLCLWVQILPGFFLSYFFLSFRSMSSKRSLDGTTYIFINICLVDQLPKGKPRLVCWEIAKKYIFSRLIKKHVFYLSGLKIVPFAGLSDGIKFVTDEKNSQLKNDTHGNPSHDVSSRKLRSTTRVNHYTREPEVGFTEIFQPILVMLSIN